MSDRYEPMERRPKRRLFTFWRVIVVLALALGTYAVFAPDPDARRGPYIALHDVNGFIGVDHDRDAVLRRLAGDDDARALVLRIDSPGGTTTGGEALFEAVRTVSETKPVVAVMGEVAASGGYIAAIAADHVVARGNTLTGSIGVVRQRPNISGLLELAGIELVEERSDEFKANPSFVSPGTPATEAWDREVMMDAYRWFRDLVGERRGLEGEALRSAANGRVFTGRQALELGLIDEIGGSTEARRWLEDQGVDLGLPLRRVEPEPEDLPLWRRLLEMRLPGAEVLTAATAPAPRLLSILN